MYQKQCNIAIQVWAYAIYDILSTSSAYKNTDLIKSACLQQSIVQKWH